MLADRAATTSSGSDVEGRFQIDWLIDSAIWPELAERRRQAAAGSAADIGGTLFEAAPGWLRFAGGAWARIPRGYPYVPSDWLTYGYHPEGDPNSPQLQRGFRGAVLAFAEFLGWLLEVDRFGAIPANYFREYHDPIARFRIRFVHDQQGLVRILSDRFIDRGYWIQVPVVQFLPAAHRFLESIEAEIQTRLPSLYDLVSFRYVRKPSQS